ncbi:MAG: HAMP domain-containing sensor histidine kinase [Chitinophagaceae bacterium]
MKFTIGFTVMFLYMIAAIIFWGISLQRQSTILYNLELENTTLKHAISDSTLLKADLAMVKEKRERRKKQYLGEGTFLLLMLLVASGFVYRSYFKQQKIERLQKNFMLSITHELKTPIAGIKLNLQTLQKHKQIPDEKKDKIVTNAIIETDRLNELSDNILLSTQLESTKQVLYADDIDLIDILRETIHIMQSRYPTHTFKSEFHKESYSMKGEIHLWNLVFSNLLANAKKYSPKQSTIFIETNAYKQGMVIAIKDEGDGIDDKEKKEIFKKFYRIGDESTRKTKGTGLGLYIVKKILTLYKYDIIVKNNYPKGSIFEIYIA